MGDELEGMDQCEHHHHSQFRIDGYDDHCGHIDSDIDVNECIQ